MSEIVLAVDLGGTNLRMAAVDRQGKILFRTKRETPDAKRAEEIVELIIEEARECQANLPEEEINFISIAVPATVNAEEGLILKAPNLPALNNFPIAGAIEKELKLKTILENDANAAAIGENWIGASKGFANSICITLGTGVGGGIIIHGKILRGVDGTAGEVGHICVEPFGVACGCGSRGCVEQYASATAVVRQAKELAREFPASDLSARYDLTSEDVYQAGKTGDKLAIEVFRRQGFYLGIALAGLINVLNPEIIIFGGGASAGWDLFLPHLQAEIAARAYAEPAKRAKLVRAELGDDAGILGAAKLAFESLKS
ncbi:MAG TPA: ROK family protein [Pyrinomonadaceae bacterium]|nr:ROK family protein [Pyrinomonadaceae bacterium]